MRRKKKYGSKGSGYISVTCPYCRKKARLVDGEELFGKRARYTKYYVCSNYPECDSYVAVHEGTHAPMGPMANKHLRKLRYEAHNVFNRLWENGHMAKDDAYAWLAVKLNLGLEEAHIGQFLEMNCKKTIELSNEALVSLRKGV